MVTNMTNLEKINNIFNNTKSNPDAYKTFKKYYDEHSCLRCNYYNCNITMCKNLPLVCYLNQHDWFESEYDKDDLFWSCWYLR